jgi:flagellar biosynthesis protein FlhG
MVLLTSGKGGVGTTTIAVNLAVALSRLTHRVLLVDADPRGGDASVLCGVHDGPTLADVLTQRHAVTDVIRRGPAQVNILPGLRGIERQGDCSAIALQHLIGELGRPDFPADVVLIDPGNGWSPVVEQFWHAADLAMVITTTETPSIMNTYALVKWLAGRGPSLPIHSLVNQVEAIHAARDVQARIGRACRRFLGIQSREAGYFPLDPQVRIAAQLLQPFMVTSPNSDAALTMERVAERLAAWLPCWLGGLPRRCSA